MCTCISTHGDRPLLGMPSPLGVSAVFSLTSECSPCLLHVTDTPVGAWLARPSSRTAATQPRRGARDPPLCAVAAAFATINSGRQNGTICAAPMT